MNILKINLLCKISRVLIFGWCFGIRKFPTPKSEHGVWIVCCRPAYLSNKLEINWTTRYWIILLNKNKAYREVKVTSAKGRKRFLLQYAFAHKWPSEMHEPWTPGGLDGLSPVPRSHRLLRDIYINIPTGRRFAVGYIHVKHIGTRNRY